MHEIVGNVAGKSFKGKVSHTNLRFELRLSSDGMSFKGIATDYFGRSNFHLKGRREE